MGEMNYAGLGRRFLALVVDSIVFCIVFFPVTRIVKGVWLMTPSDHIWDWGPFIFDPICLIFLIVIVLYFILMEGFLGWTIGKKMLGIRVVAEGATVPGLKRSLWRNLFRLVDGLPIFSLLGALMIYFTREHTRAGDLVAKTRVIKVDHSPLA